MHLQIKDQKQNAFKIPVKLSDTIFQVKEKIKINECAESDDVDDLKLIYSGVILNNDSTVEECEFDENKSVILICNPTKKAPVRKGKANDLDVTKSGESNSITGEKVASNGEERDNINQLVSMGYTEKIVRKCLRAAFNHPERAIEYLVNGIPEDVGRERCNTSESESEVLSRNNLLAALPNINSFRKIMMNDPVEVSKILTKISLRDPRVYDKILQNQETFIDLLNTEGENESRIVNKEFGDDDYEAVDRIVNMGFQKEIVMQAYQACEFNEEGTAELMLALKK